MSELFPTGGLGPNHRGAMLLGFGNHVSAVLTGVTICSMGMPPQELPAATDEPLESLQQLSKTGMKLSSILGSPAKSGSIVAANARARALN